MNDLIEEFGGTAVQKLAVVVDPPGARSVRVIRDMKAYELKLVPVSNSVNVNSPNVDVPASGLVICITSENSIAYVVPKLPVQKKDAPPPSERAGKATSELIVPFWCVKPEANQQVANMTFQNFRARVGNSSVVIPVLTNHCPLKSEDVLSLYAPGGAKTKWHIPDNTKEIEAPNKEARKSM